MGLPNIIEYLLSIEDAGGRRLVQQGVSQSVATIPPLTQIVYDAEPWADAYYNIVFSSVFDTTMVPNSFYAYGQYSGSRASEGVVTQGLLGDRQDSFVLISKSNPARILLRNLTVLNQYYIGRVYYVRIETEEDAKLIKEKLGETSGNLSESAQQIIQLMKSATAKMPIVGGA
jgi:hypothetical protein